jgi:hypothetical protein
MHPISILAHGALGPYDELIFLAVGIVFVAIMILSWLRSRSSAPTGPTEQIAMNTDDSIQTPDQEQRFRLD